jgi:transcription elongation factor Elf1
VSAIATLFRHCPSCGRRFEVRLVRKEQVEGSVNYEKTREGENLPRAIAISSTGVPAEPQRFVAIQLSTGAPTSAEVPEADEVREFRLDFKCKHCGHEWSETTTKEVKGHTSSDYKGD